MSPRLLPGYTHDEEVQVALFAQQQRAKMLSRAAAPAGKKRGRASDDRRSFVEANLVGGAASPGDAANRPSRRAQARATGLPEPTAMRLLEQAERKRTQLSVREAGIAWSFVKCRRGHSRISHHGGREGSAVPLGPRA